MDVQKERKITFFTAFERKSTFFTAVRRLLQKQARSLSDVQYWYRSFLWMSLSSESSVSGTIPKYL